MLIHRLKILAALILSFVVVEGYTYYTKHPAVLADISYNTKGLLSSLKFRPGSLTKLFSLNFRPSDQVTNPPTNQDNSFDLPTYNQPFDFAQGKPSPTYKAPTGARPTGIRPTKRPVYKPTSVQPTGLDDELLDFPYEAGAEEAIQSKPTKAPKPTKVPSLPPITSDIRPGNSLLEIYKEVNKRACYPVELLMAFKTMETGERFKKDSPATIKIYNTYGWWITGAGDPCYGYGYSHQTGIVPSDSVNAGKSCNSAIGNPTDIKVMGVISVSEWLQEVAQKYIISTIPKNDRRVIFDNALIIAYISRSQLGDPPTDCNNWPDAVVKTAAQKLMGGVCDYYYSNGVSGDYCKQILDLYKQFKKEGY
ncbi:MAG: hypothetical protein UR68_C0040G0005 [Candidatus Roizmanbacteria bacterium GW2011_GWA2_35_19]|uniref:Uncharacterized protein n=2 Tax=Candidatus Roizmaniibacteriota TaxID=1752723 RepID=A0A0G0BMH7_9BACT|nr:MAG: hypothetical protein UR63_C0021G0013 [Candidatus Roizmanbacteria bacterium GW2011_GWC2_35_12]KKP70618.1 MAG: hypothetical protein UR68_C0040G0005 [Candidatus Roizmanbacteria bacterium GW2011_GWA2_35_19]